MIATQKIPRWKCQLPTRILRLDVFVITTVMLIVGTFAPTETLGTTALAVAAATEVVAVMPAAAAFGISGMPLPATVAPATASKEGSELALDPLFEATIAHC